MRFSIILAGAFAALVSAQSSTSVALDPVQSAKVECLNKCAAGDVGCQSHCIAVPNPSPEQAIATNDCIAKCPQGNGTEADAAAYKVCADGCIVEHYYDSTSGTPQPTGAGGSGSGSGSAGTTTGTGARATGTSTQTGTGASSNSTGTPNAAPAVVGVSAAGLVGLLAAMLAL